MGTIHPLFTEGRRGSDTSKEVSVTIGGTKPHSQSGQSRALLDASPVN